MMWRRFAIAGSAVAGLLLVMLVGSFFWLDSQSGRNFVARQIAAFEFENGLNMRIGRIDGSIYGDATLSDVRFHDPKGEFARAPEIRLDWSPLSFFNRGVAIHALTAQELNISRLPAFRVVPDRGDPLLPDLDIQIKRLQVDRIVFAKGITGGAHVASLSGNLQIADRRAIIDATAGSIGGDRFVLKLDAVPEKNQFDVDMKLDAPAKGLFAGLAGRPIPMTANLSGRGDWRKWDGVLTAQLASEGIANLALTAREGTFAVRGTAAPAKILADSFLMRAFSPVAKVDFTAKFADRAAKIRGSFRSAAAEVDVVGGGDFGEGNFDDLALDFRILRPAIIGTNVSGSDIRGTAVLNGAFAGPTVAYTASTGRLAFDATTFEAVTVTGEMQGKADRFIIPVNAKARRVTGINQIAGGLLTNVRVNGDIAIADGRLLSDNLKVHSDRINAKALLVGDIDKGVYTTALNGKLDGFQVNSVGLFNVVADVDIETKRGRGYALVGTVKAHSTRLFSQGFQNFLGGQMFVNAGIRYGNNGILQITRASLVSPLFRINSGSGSYVTRGGGMVFNGEGYSNQYGPVRVGMTGTFDRPEYRITATSPGFGIGMSNVVGIVTRSPRGYAIAITGSTDYGPISGDVDVLSGNGPLTIDIMRGNFAGVGIMGQIKQAASGPFVGTLMGVGAGFDGTIALSAQGAYQRAVVDATARNAVLSGTQKLAIGRGIVNADIILSDSPQVIADVQVENAVMNDVTIAAARAKVNYRAGIGTQRGAFARARECRFYAPIVADSC